MANRSNDKINSRSHAATEDVATAKADAQLNADNEQGCEGQFSLSGDTRLTAGSNIKMTGFDRFDGKYRIKQATHSISRSNGYTTSVDFTKIDNVATH
ncbi:hypothetical protein [Psychrobacter aquaticus]|uniref:Uncharacterized protein n=1 Tax=Psychrobacter aquaticus CMS 56 TaxID=1354303 RepID=U4TBP3_9GAMM|nr:hypothetical protein [Psychrobacter aquaticus]ERL56129.1 hypothetical protein M917_0807 [Psychrobacter aquaticus CMS 56]